MIKEFIKKTFVGKILARFLSAERRDFLKVLFFRLINKKPPSYVTRLSLGVSSEHHDNEIIVSLTSYPARVKALATTVSTLLSQTLKPTKVILWLADSQFPQREKDLPRSLLRLKDYGLTIAWCEDIRSYKKLIPTLKEYPDAVVVTADDDVYYHPDWLKLLYNSYQQMPNAIHAHCVRHVRMSSSYDGFEPYSSWEHTTSEGVAQFSFLQIGVGGVLYPPHCFHKDILKKELFMSLAPHADDLWFWAMAVLAKRPIVRVKGAMMPAINYRASTAESLCKMNLDGGANDIQLKRLYAHYPELIQTLQGALS